MSITSETRRESYEALDAETLKKAIVNIFSNGGTYSAKEVSVVMYRRNLIEYPVRQAVAPRLTELVAEGVLEVVGKVYDYDTERNVAAYRLVRE